MPDEVTANRDAGAPHPAPAMDVDPVAFIERLIYRIEDVNHCFTRRNAVITNGKALIGCVDIVNAGLFL